ncbi:MAG: RNA polymerase sigma factor, partial [Candidatus Aminicenantales bacterium]
MAATDPIAEKTDEELARDARAGSRRSFEELASRYKRRLFVYLRPRLGSDEDAEDMVQDTFLKIYRSIDRYDPAYRFSTWLYTSASRLAIDSFRKAALARDKSADSSGRDIPD